MISPTRTRTARTRTRTSARTRALTALAVCAAATVPLLTTAGPAGAADHGARARSGTGAPSLDGLHGPVVTHPVQPDLDYARGEVCAFPTHAKTLVSDMTTKTWTNDAGDPVYSVTSGPLVMRMTNLDTGKSVTRDISGTGSTTYLDENREISSGGDWGAPFHSGDDPANKWLISRDFMSVLYTKDGDTKKRKLLALEGRYEDLCRTLG